ncbi:MAG: bifunctional riboflavin kinase/FAD synthetase [Chthoniobacteraceae bacterium]
MQAAPVNVLHSITDLAELRGPMFLAIGVFDGVHLGHRAVLEHTLRAAASGEGTAVALTFDPHPATVLRPRQAPALLTSTRHKLRLIGLLGFQHALVVEFNARFAATEPGDFVKELAGAARPLRQICVGEGWAFGKGRAGNLDMLRSLADGLGFEVIGLPAVAVDGTAVSSTIIRAAVEAGDLLLAGRLLGREFSVLGTVIAGRKMGRTLGFPTANLRPESEQLPPNGVYAVRVAMNDTEVPGVANIGTRPTVTPDATERVLEVHLLDFTGDLYGTDLEVSFCQFLRAEKKFPDLEALRVQIAADIGHARKALAG